MAVLLGLLNISIDKKSNNKEQALKEADDSKKGANTSDKSEHNTDHKNERSPDNRAKAKQRAGGSPQQFAPVPPFPDGGGEKASSGSQDNPESEHEPKGKQGRPSNTKPTNRGPPVNKQIQRISQNRKQKQKQTQNTTLKQLIMISLGFGKSRTSD